MEKSSMKVWMMVLGVSALLVATTGCKGDGDGSTSLFGGGGSESLLAGLSGGSGDGAFGFSGGSGELGGGSGSIATLDQPEPASLVLFGSGLAGLAYLRRRKTRKHGSK